MSSYKDRLARALARVVCVVACVATVILSTIPVTMAAVESVDDSSFKKEVDESSLPVFIDFYAVWCAPCKKVSPIIDELSTEYSGKIKFVRVDIDKAPKTAERFSADSLPTLVLLSKKVSKGVSISGYRTKEALTAFIEDALKKVQ
jgi:thioredoxin